MAVRHQKCNAMAASAGTQQCSYLELLIVIDNAVAKQLRNSIDSEAFLKRLKGDRQLAEMILKVFLEHSALQLSSLRGRLDDADAPGVRLQAHTLRGGSANVSAEVLRALCRETEEAAASNELSRARVLLPRLEEQFELLKVTLKQSGWV
jgi:HPt (histidine-containing phosphotransfer) domain-containing protein